MISRPLVHPALRIGCLTVSFASACASEPGTSATFGEASDSSTTGTAGAAGTTESGSGTSGEIQPTTSGTTDDTAEPTTDGEASTTDGEASTTDGEASTTGGEAPAIPFVCPGGAIGSGMNSIDVGGASRTFLADFPADVDRPLGVVFSWHGYGDSAMNFRAAVGLDPDADPALPVVVITPEDSGLPPPLGLDWDIAGGAAPDNVDLALFEAVLGCLDAQYEIDAARIYSFGFSAGSVMTNLLHSSYPELITTIVSESGAWFNDPSQADLVNIFDIDWDWPALDPAVGGTVLLTHGGPTDVTVLNILDLEASAQAALPFLAAGGRTVVDCAHMQGHTLHPEVPPELIGVFLSAHRAGQPSPYLSDGLEGYPASCTLRVP
ncbi:PHB depolymerase family esterase [Nannocystis pusilla]|uniref:Esterase n=1 Tax=Nannocystis pusilla TaxID=889268 RepID=A0ABS7TP15_9BACT|nr:PHB depolymerase family esterase [Nannocystis pusilla]MBZ5709971.1 hypothetical protein [Nannocystis pusilla]